LSQKPPGAVNNNMSNHVSMMTKRISLANPTICIWRQSDGHNRVRYWPTPHNQNFGTQREYWFINIYSVLVDLWRFCKVIGLEAKSELQGIFDAGVCNSVALHLTSL
jgi:hypothetical protein